jgi:hypothetical protein
VKTWDNEENEQMIRNRRSHMTTHLQHPAPVSSSSWGTCCGDSMSVDGRVTLMVGMSACRYCENGAGESGGRGIVFRRAGRIGRSGSSVGGGSVGGGLSGIGAGVSWIALGSLPNSSIGISSPRGARYLE